MGEFHCPRCGSDNAEAEMAGAYCNDCDWRTRHKGVTEPKPKVIQRIEEDRREAERRAE